MRIKCAAILYHDKVYEGRSHCEIGNKMIEDGVCPKPYLGGETQGFVTECGMFVRRPAALRIAVKAGQVVRGQTLSDHELYSEDLRR